MQEASSDEEGVEVDERPRRKALKPPGAAAAAAAKKAQQQQRQQQQQKQQEGPQPMEATGDPLAQPVTPVLAAAAGADAEGTPGSPTSPTTRAAVRQAAAEVAAEAAAAPVQAPTLRKSTRERIEVAEKERARIEQVRPPCSQLLCQSCTLCCGGIFPAWGRTVAGPLPTPAVHDCKKKLSAPQASPRALSQCAV